MFNEDEMTVGIGCDQTQRIAYGRVKRGIREKLLLHKRHDIVIGSDQISKARRVYTRATCCPATCCLLPATKLLQVCCPFVAGYKGIQVNRDINE